MSIFKVGQKVIRTGPSSEFFTKGDEYMVDEYMSGSPSVIKVGGCWGTDCLFKSAPITSGSKEIEVQTTLDEYKKRGGKNHHMGQRDAVVTAYQSSDGTISVTSIDIEDLDGNGICLVSSESHDHGDFAKQFLDWKDELENSIEFETAFREAWVDGGHDDQEDPRFDTLREASE